MTRLPSRSVRHAAPAGRQRGVTLVELFIVVIVAAVLAAVAIPNMITFVQNNARATRINSVVTALNVARNDAISRQRTVTVCASADQATCSGANTFETGWIVIKDRGANGVLDAALDVNGDGVISNNEAQDVVLRVFQPDMAGAATLRARTGEPPGASVNLARVSYAVTGLLHASVPAGAHFTYCDDRGAAAARAVLLGGTGHPGLSSDTDAPTDGVHDDSSGNNLTCP